MVYTKHTILKNILYNFIKSIPSYTNDIILEETCFLDKADIAVLEYIVLQHLEMIGEPNQFYQNKELRIDIDDLKSYLHKLFSNEYYFDVKQNLFEMSVFSINGLIKITEDVKNVFNVSFFQSIEICTDDHSDKQYVNICFSDRLNNIISQRQIADIYPKESDNLLNEIEKIFERE